MLRIRTRRTRNVKSCSLDPTDAPERIPPENQKWFCTKQFTKQRIYLDGWHSSTRRFLQLEHCYPTRLITRNHPLWSRILLRWIQQHGRGFCDSATRNFECSDISVFVPCPVSGRSREVLRRTKPSFIQPGEIFSRTKYYMARICPGMNHTIQWQQGQGSNATSSSWHVWAVQSKVLNWIGIVLISFFTTCDRLRPNDHCESLPLMSKIQRTCFQNLINIPTYESKKYCKQSLLFSISPSA